MKLNDIIGQRIKELRLEKNLTQHQLAQVCNMTQDTISLWERGLRAPSAELLLLLADYFNVTTDFLLGRQNY